MKIVSKKKGVTVIICCHNSIKRLTPTFTALAEQNVDPNIKWEIIVIDNASEDDTAYFAWELWSHLNKKPRIPFRVEKEMIPGLGNARKRGIELANYRYILFCDDDNWLANDYVQRVYDILSRDGNIAACGGKGIPVFETEQPDWFDHYFEAFAVGSQEASAQDNKIISLYGAGLAMNYHALEALEKSGFKPLMIGRTGKKLSSSEDTELTNAFVLMGYRLVYDKELTFYHYLPKERLQFSYLKKLYEAFGTDGPVRNIYYAFVSNRFFHRFIRFWSFHLLLSIFRLIKYLIVPPKKNGRLIYFNWSISYIKRLLLIRKDYSGILENIKRLKEYTPQAIRQTVILYLNPTK